MARVCVACDGDHPWEVAEVEHQAGLVLVGGQNSTLEFEMGVNG
jgi:hypothetical protein